MPITPGPWKYGVRDDEDRSMWLSLGDPRTGPHYQGDLVASKADARLIVAAPDLLRELKLAVQRLEDEGCEFNSVNFKAAIAKAEGK